MATVTVRYEDDTVNPVAKMTAVHISAAGVDITNEITDAPILYYLSADHATADQAKSVVFSGDFSWDGWIAPAAGAWTFNLRTAANDASVANSGAITFS